MNKIKLVVSLLSVGLGWVSQNANALTYITSDTKIKSDFVLVNDGPYLVVNNNVTVTFVENISLSGLQFFGADGSITDSNFLINPDVTINTTISPFIFNVPANNMVTNKGYINGDISFYPNCTLGTLNNSGTISGQVFVGSDAPTPGADTSIGTLNNSGTIGNGILIQYLTQTEIAIRNLNNSGHIYQGININGLFSDGPEAGIRSLTNTGSIDGGIHVLGVSTHHSLGSSGIQSLVNAGSINGGVSIQGVVPISATSPQNGIGSMINSGSIVGGINISDIRTSLTWDNETVVSTGIVSLTNTGSIGGGITVDDVDVGSTGIGALNNLQGATTSSSLAYTGMLPTNYNIITNRAGHYGQLSGTDVTGSTTFGIYEGSQITARHYNGVLQGIASANLTGSGTTRTGSFDGMTWTLSETSIGNWDLSFAGISVAQTQSSVHSLASKLRGAFSSQAVATNYANMNTYDCNLFDERGLCISVGGQQTYVDSPSSNLTSTVVVAGYKVSPTLRIGGFLNQNINNSTSRNVEISNANPLMGLFAVWNQNEDQLGYQVKVANAYQDKDVRTVRDAVETSEAGRGSTELNTQSYVGELSYAFLANEDKTLVRPYAALRYTRIKQDAYTEDRSSAVTAPLTYSALSDRSTAGLVGVKVDHKLAEKLNLKASLGVEQDLYHHVDDLKATGVSGLTSENFNDNIKRTRPVASIGAYYMPAKNQRISADLYYQQLPFQSTGSATAYVNYMIGF